MASIPTREQLVTFLNTLPINTVADEWLNELTMGLQQLFPEIDHLTFFYNMLDEEHRDSLLNDANVKITANESHPLGFSASAVPVSLRERIEEVIDTELGLIERSRGDFHMPTTFTYRDPAWLGTIILFRESKKPPFSESMLATFGELENFFTFLLKDFSFRYHAAHPADRLFYEAVLQITESMGLTQQEMRVLMFRLLGRSYKEIGEMLGIAASTVKNHLTNVHSKAGVHTQSELFARYFAPKFGLFNRLTGEPSGEE